MAKRALFIILAVCTLAAMAAPLRATRAQEPVTAYFFYGSGCPYCQQAESYLSRVKLQSPDVRVQYFEVWNDPRNDALMAFLLPRFNGDANGVPRTVIGNRVIAGFNAQYTPNAIAQAIAAARQLEDPNPAAAAIAQWQEAQQADADLPAKTHGGTTGGKGLFGTAIAVVLVLLVAAIAVTGLMVLRNKR